MQALDRWADSECCASRKYVKKVTIDNFARADAIDVELLATYEQRELRPRHRPYDGGMISQGMSPNPWDLPCVPSKWYLQEKKEMPLPGSEAIRICFKCCGGGRITCPHCHGAGRTRCHHCNGNGRLNNADGTSRDCPHCNGGYERCSRCGSSGSIVCDTCNGARQLVHYQAVVVYFNRVENHKVLDGEAAFLKEMPLEKIKAAPGVPMWQEENFMVFPAAQYNQCRISPNISQRIDGMIMEFATMGSSKGVLRRQQLTVKGVPVFRAEYKKGEERKVFFVFGTNMNVHAPDWPCCCCVCM